MTTLLFAQILFYFSVSFAVIILAVMIGFVIYHLIKVTKSLEQISENIENASDELHENLKDALTVLGTLPILSFFFKTKKRKEKKGSKKSK